MKQHRDTSRWKEGGRKSYQHSNKLKLSTADNLKEKEPTALRSWFHFPTADLKIDNKAPLGEKKIIIIKGGNVPMFAIRQCL